VILVGFLYFIGNRDKVIVSNTSNYKSNGTNSTTTNRSNSNSSGSNVIGGDVDDTDLDVFTLPTSIGPYEQQSQVRGNPADDFPGADEITKANYVKQGKEVNFVVAKFSTREATKLGYEDFLKGFKSSGAKIIGKQKVKNKAGVVNGEVTLFTFEKKWNALFYTEKHGGRYYAPDRYTMKEFSDEFAKVFKVE